MDERILYKYAEKKANKFNIYCLLVMSLLAIIAEILNELGVFALEKSTVRICMLVVVVISLMPAILFLILNKFMPSEKDILENENLKWVIVASIFLSSSVLCISLSFHVTLVFVFPTVIAAQYKSDKRLTIISFTASMVMVAISVYGAYLFGVYDANLLKPLTKDEASIFENRLALFKTERMISVLCHYVIPRMLCVAAIDYVGLAISKRNTEMINTEINLSKKVQDEIMAKSQIENRVIEHLADIIESRDIETGEHIKRTKQYVSILVNHMKDLDEYRDILTPKMCECIINASPLHDIGKISVSDLILCKPGKLTEEEFNKMKTHTTKGGEIIDHILNDIGDKELMKVAHDIAVYHHEKWNGFGYPYGLKGEDIPLPGRIMAIADVFDALVSKRVYKEPMDLALAVNVIIGEAGIHFDPNIISIFVKLKENFMKIASGD